MDQKRIPLMMLVIVALSGLFPFFHVEGAYPGVYVLDGRGDVTLYTYNNRKVSGNEEIDIKSLETLERLTRVEAYLTMYGDIDRSYGHIYTMSIGGVVITYDNGTFQAIESSTQALLSDVDFEVTQKQIIAGIPKRYLQGDFIINGTAHEYLIDHSAEGGIDYYLDSVSGKGTSKVSHYQILLEDEPNDVSFHFIEQSVTEAAHLDILHVGVMDHESPVSLEMTLAFDAVVDPEVTYSFFVARDTYIVRNGYAEVENGEGTINDVEISGSTIILSIYRDDIGPGDLVGGLSRQEMDDGGWVEDICPGSRSIQMDIVPMVTGTEVGMELRIDENGQGEMILFNRGLPPDQVSSILETLDTDRSGEIEDDEVNGYLGPLIHAIEDFPIIFVNEKEADISVVSASLDIDGSLSYELEVNFIVESGEGPISIRIVPFRKVAGSRIGLEVGSSLKIILPEDHAIDPFSLEPYGLGNHISPSGSSVIMTSEDPEDMDLFTTGIVFTYKMSSEKVSGNDTVVYEDVPSWVYVAGIILFILAIVIVYRVGRGKKPKQEDF